MMIRQISSWNNSFNSNQDGKGNMQVCKDYNIRLQKHIFSFKSGNANTRHDQCQTLTHSLHVFNY